VTRNPYVFNFGLNKAGSTSLSKALAKLGIKTAHWRCTGANKEQVDLHKTLKANIESNCKPFHSLDHIYRGFSDFGGEPYFKLLDKAYPRSLFILTLRPIDQWIDSRARHVKRNLANRDYAGSFTSIDIKAWTRLYRSTVKQSQDYFSSAAASGKLLTLQITEGDGWEKLCDFLEAPHPGTPFPHDNEKGQAHDN
jgi:hypothetical protein